MLLLIPQQKNHSLPLSKEKVTNFIHQMSKSSTEKQVLLTSIFNSINLLYISINNNDKLSNEISTNLNTNTNSNSTTPTTTTLSLIHI